MSQTFAKTLDGFIHVVTSPLSERQRGKTLGALNERMNAKQTVTIKTPKGDLMFQALRSGYTSSAVTRFFDDEPDTLEWIDTALQDGDIVWDIGANIGLYSLYASLNDNVQVYSFEPSAFNFATLVEHVAINGRDSNIHPLCVALSDQNGVFPLHMASLSIGRAGNALHEACTQDGAFDATFKQSVPAFRGDDALNMLNIPAPNHIKLDVDSIEGPILAGMPNVLKSIKTILVEVEGENEVHAKTRIEPHLNVAGLVEDMAFRQKGNPRNRLYVRNT